MERKIGEIFEYNGEWYQCVGGTCRNCSFYYDTVCKNITTIGSTNFGNCHCSLRTDHKSVIFKKLEKGGEPYDFQKRTFQTYKLYTIPFLSGDVKLVAIPSKDNNTIEIEIKEDMEERELDPRMVKVIDEATQKMGEEIGRQIEANINKQRMKPFSLELAKDGKPVCTRDGRKVRIICFDCKGIQPIVGLETQENGDESIETYHLNGRFNDDDTTESKGDLMMLTEKKEGWVNVYYDNDASSHRGCRFIYDTKEQAVKEAGSAYITTIRINWEE